MGIVGPRQGGFFNAVQRQGLGVLQGPVPGRYPSEKTLWPGQIEMADEGFDHGGVPEHHHCRPSEGGGDGPVRDVSTPDQIFLCTLLRLLLLSRLRWYLFEYFRRTFRNFLRPFWDHDLGGRVYCHL